MSSNWIKMRSDIAEDYRVLAIAARLSIDNFGVVGRLHAVWSWLDKNSKDGLDVRISSAFLDQKTACPGFADALRAVGWLDGRDGALTFPGYLEHNGSTAKLRAQAADRQSAFRNAHRNATSVTTVTEAPLPEKRREEKIEETITQGARGRPANLAEVINYGASPHCGVPRDQCEAFFDHYQSTGWKIDGVPIDDWQARLRVWKRNNQRAPSARPRVSPRASSPSILEAPQ